MSGNVGEFCWDWYKLYTEDELDCEKKERVIRGGGTLVYITIHEDYQVFYRRYTNPYLKRNIGIRLIKTRVVHYE